MGFILCIPSFEKGKITLPGASSHHHLGQVFGLKDPDGDQLNISDLKKILVLDINHQQMENPEDITPDASSENTQFLPIEDQADPILHSEGLFIHVYPRYRFSNTIGGVLAAYPDSWPRPENP